MDILKTILVYLALIEASIFIGLFLAYVYARIDWCPLHGDPDERNYEGLYAIGIFIFTWFLYIPIRGLYYLERKIFPVK